VSSREGVSDRHARRPAVGAAKPVGEGRYQLLGHRDHTELAYVLELPRRHGPAQEEFEIKDAASYVVAIKNPEVAALPGFPAHRRSQRWPSSRESTRP
jgi:hypothetical protein